MRHTLIRLLPLLLLLSALPAVAGQSLDFGRYKELRNEYVKVTDIKERDRFEERYLESGGKVTLQKVPFKEVMVTAEIVQRPPSNMDTMFAGDAAQPFLKVCMAPFDKDGKALDESCETLRFQSLVRGNIGTANFRIEAGTARYEFHMAQRPSDKGSSIKLWVPTN